MDFLKPLWRVTMRLCSFLGLSKHSNTTEECDCQNPPPDDWDGKNGVYHISNECPVHNWNPWPAPCNNG